MFYVIIQGYFYIFAVISFDVFNYSDRTIRIRRKEMPLLFRLIIYKMSFEYPSRNAKLVIKTIFRYILL